MRLIFKPLLYSRYNKDEIIVELYNTTLQVAQLSRRSTKHFPKITLLTKLIPVFLCSWNKPRAKAASGIMVFNGVKKCLTDLSKCFGFKIFETLFVKSLQLLNCSAKEKQSTRAEESMEGSYNNGNSNPSTH